MPKLSISDPTVRAVLVKALKIGVKTFVPGGGAIVAGAEALWEAYRDALMNEFSVPVEERAALLEWIATDDE
ncbi:MAG TPA: hypothetical protein VF761_16700 [Gemmatimonadaceae bacterium]